MDGEKRVRVGNRNLALVRGDTLALAQPTSTISQIVRAPYVSLMLAVDAELLARLETFPRAASANVTEPLTRLVALLESPAEIPALAPLLQSELFYRLLAGPAGGALREIARGHDAAIVAATNWLDAHYAEPFSAERLAARVHLSVSALYARFKARKRVTPLQYQKRLRLDAARLLLLSSDVDVGTVAHRVGYASVAQFTRDYRERFSSPPRRDVDQLRRG